MKSFVLKHRKTGSYFAGFIPTRKGPPEQAWAPSKLDAVTYTEEQLARLQKSRAGFVRSCFVLPA